MFNRGGDHKKAKVPRTEPPPDEGKPRIVRFTNCCLLRDHDLVAEDLFVQGGVIADPKKLFWDGQKADVTIDCEGMILAPGFIDLQLNGAFGCDFSTPDGLSESVDKVSAGVLAHGVTAYLPTVITSSAETYQRVMPKLTPRAGRPRSATGGPAGAAILGVHLEGPFISPDKRGCHPPEYVRAVEGPQALQAAYGDHLAHARLVTLAPELPGADKLIDELVPRNVVVSVGHSMATLSQTEAALKRGATMCTHLFNAMPSFDHLEPGLVCVLGLTSCRPFFGLIADGVHVHPASLKIAARARIDSVVLVTDAIAAMGMPDGEYILGGIKVKVAEQRATLAGTDTLAGATTSMDECVRRFKAYCDVTSVEAIEAATLHPAQVLGIEASKGALTVGADADLVLLDEQLQVHRTYVGGSLAWERGGGDD
eukprot:Transcript_1006.p1 GENE.Transcript_1006~~Transcript_1006.p1  ORF type:complete len:458 (-),score=170.98 Transcript_1006:435-1709(-)